MQSKKLAKLLNPYDDISLGENAPQIVNAYIEGDTIKYEFVPQSGLLEPARTLAEGFEFPTYYGSIPQTLGQDEDPVDLFVFCSTALEREEIVSVEVQGVLKCIGNGQEDHKILAVCANDSKLSNIRQYEDLDISIIYNFYKSMPKPEGYTFQMLGFGGKEEAYRIINEGHRIYDQAHNRIPLA